MKSLFAAALLLGGITKTAIATPIEPAVAIVEADEVDLQLVDEGLITPDELIHKTADVTLLPEPLAHSNV